jgi:DNA-binding transcriptional LysR family regulator
VLVDRGLGVSLIPDWAPPWPEGLRVSKWPIKGAPVRRIGLVWPQVSPKLRLIRSLKDEMAQLLKGAGRIGKGRER